MTGFEYPTDPHVRRHGPVGYKDYESYRDWLRDEFFFRCVYCLHREQWYGRGATFHIDHFTPVANEGATCEYTNLLYACATCNEAKKVALGVPNPCEVALADCLRILPDGHVEALNDEGKKLRLLLRLDSTSNVRNRSRSIRTLEALRTTHAACIRNTWASLTICQTFGGGTLRATRNQKELQTATSLFVSAVCCPQFTKRPVGVPFQVFGLRKLANRQKLHD